VSAHVLETADDQLAFALAGNATFTLVSLKTEVRYTYRVRQCEDKPTLYFVAVMTGADNETSYQYLGTVIKTDVPQLSTYRYGVKSKIGEHAPSAGAFYWWWKHKGHAQIQVWHEGRCGRCNRKLTVPESIANGIGPECMKYLGV